MFGLFFGFYILIKFKLTRRDVMGIQTKDADLNNLLVNDIGKKTFTFDIISVMQQHHFILKTIYTVTDYGPADRSELTFIFSQLCQNNLCLLGDLMLLERC